MRRLILIFLVSIFVLTLFKYSIGLIGSPAENLFFEQGSTKSFSNHLDRDAINGKFAIDEQAACAVIKLGGGFYDQDLEAIVPYESELIHEEWKKKRGRIAKKIGKIAPAASKRSIFWRNSAASIDELLED